MTFEEFEALTKEEKSVLYNNMVETISTIENITAERDSFKTENETLLKENTDKSEELKKTKEMNFTLARKLDTSSKRESVEDILHNMFK